MISRRIIPVFLYVVVFGLATAGAEELTLPFLLERVAASPDVKQEELGLLKARAAYREQSAFLSPQLYLALPVELLVSPFIYYSYNPALAAALLADPQAWNFSPGLTLSQALPTAGTLDLGLTNKLSVFDPGTTTNPSIEPYIPDVAFDNNISLSLSVNQPLFFGDAFGASLTIIEETWRLAEARCRHAKNELVYKAARDFFTLQQLKSSEAAAGLAVREARLSHQDVKKKFDMGTASRLDLLKEESRLKKAELDHFDAVTGYENAAARLAAVYGVKEGFSVAEGNAVIALPDMPSPEEVAARVRTRNPEILMGKNEWEIRKAQVTTAKCELAPTLTLGTSLQLDSVNDYSTNLWDALADPFDSSANPFFKFSFKLTLRLLDGGTAQQKIRQSELEAEMGRFRLESKSGDLEGCLADALGRLKRSDLNKEYARLALEVATQEYDQGKKDFSLGRISRLDLDRMDLALRTARLKEMQARNEDVLIKLEVFKLMGEDLQVLLTEGE